VQACFVLRIALFHSVYYIYLPQYLTSVLMLVSLQPNFKVTESLYDLVIMVNITYVIVSHVKNLASF
jgi:hypothetical protein